MLINSAGKLSITLILAISSNLVIPSSEVFFCRWLAFANEIRSFGESGQKSFNGGNGQNGRNSENLTIFADGSPLALQLFGQDGFPGENGQSGGNGACAEQPKNINYSLQAANGGDGGDGGDGGNGGNGGSLTIYSDNLANLRQISVNAGGGKGGQPGQGGKGGEGCQCTIPFWNLEVCSGTPGSPNYTCSTREFFCQNGQDGNFGRGGRAGKDGELGRLVLINRNQPLTDDQPVATVQMSQLKDRGFILSRNKWETRSGASGFFAPGSIIADQYLELVERQENSFLIIWNAPQPFSPFANKMVTLGLKNDQGIEISFPDDIWLEADTRQQSFVTELSVFNAMLKSEATQLNSEGLSGSGSSLILHLVDLANRSDIVGTQFSIKYGVNKSPEAQYRPVLSYETKYQGDIPSELINLQDDRFAIYLGKLPINAEDLVSGTAVEIELTATRSFSGKSAQQKMVIKQVIGR